MPFPLPTVAEQFKRLSDSKNRDAVTANDLYAPLIADEPETTTPSPRDCEVCGGLGDVDAMYDYINCGACAGTGRKSRLPDNLPPYDYAVKSWPHFFEPMVALRKLHDMRNKADREYKVGDRMLLREFDPFGRGYTGRCAVATITYITSNETPCAMSSVGLGNDMAILSVRVSGPYPDDDRWA